MHLEIERKFLVLNDDYKKEAMKTIKMVQGYLNSNPERAVRIRITDEDAFLTIKGKSTQNGLARLEWEQKIEVKDAHQLINLCEPFLIEKNRYIVHYEGFIFEVDEFLGDNKGIVIAEIELASEQQTFQKPSWLGKEVTGDANYYNASLSKHPYKNWL